MLNHSANKLWRCGDYPGSMWKSQRSSGRCVLSYHSAWAHHSLPAGLGRRRKGENTPGKPLVPSGWTMSPLWVPLGFYWVGTLVLGPLEAAEGYLNWGIREWCSKLEIAALRARREMQRKKSWVCLWQMRQHLPIQKGRCHPLRAIGCHGKYVKCPYFYLLATNIFKYSANPTNYSCGPLI